MECRGLRAVTGDIRVLVGAAAVFLISGHLQRRHEGEIAVRGARVTDGISRNPRRLGQTGGTTAPRLS